MKKVLFVAFAVVSISQAVHAQKGSLLVGGSINMVSSKTPSTPNDSKSSSFEFSPTIGYQFHDNWTAGLITDIGTSKYTSATNVATKTNTFDIGPFIRYSKSLSAIFSVYGQLQGVFGSTKIADSKATTAAINAFPAVFINVKNGFGLNFNIGGIGYNSNKPTGANASHTFGITFGQAVGIGISKNFGLHKKK